MGFLDILFQSWKDYKINFKVINKLMIFYFFGWILLFLVSQFTSFLGAAHSAFLFLAFVASYLLSIFSIGTITFASVDKKKFNYNSSVDVLKERYGKYLGLNIVLFVFLALLFLLLVIPGIIFLNYWMFSAYVFFKDKKGISESLRGSKQLVKGHWWKLFGYNILFLLIYALIDVAFYAVGEVFSLATGVSYFVSIFGLLSNLFLIPFLILFYNNIYQNLKSRKF